MTMERLQRAAVLLSLIDELHAVDSWSGETHVQKTTYFLQELLHVPLGYDFILYKHGPYSFNLSDDITDLRADAILKLEPRPPYGPGIISGAESQQVRQRFPRTVRTYRHAIELVARRLGPMHVAELERVATALYVTRETGASSGLDARADRIRELKPYISPELARDAVRQVDVFIAEARGAHAIA